MLQSKVDFSLPCYSVATFVRPRKFLKDLGDLGDGLLWLIYMCIGQVSVGYRRCLSPCHSPRLPPHLHPMCHILLLHHRHRKYHQCNHNRPRHCLSEICFVCVIYKREEGYIIFISYWRLEKTPDEQICHFHFSIKVVYEGCGRRDYITLSN